MAFSEFQFIRFAKGETVFKDGDEGDCAYIVLSGEVSVDKQNNGQEIHLATLGANQVIGEMALVSPGVRTATVTAKTSCELLLLEQSQFIERRSELDLVMKVIFEVILKRFRQTLNTIGGAHELSPSSDAINAEMEQALYQLNFESEIKRGIVQGEFELYYQPIIDLASGAIAGAEGLMRWNHPTRGLVPPNEFIPVAEKSNLISDITKVAIENACRDYQKIAIQQLGNVRNIKPMFVALNVSGRDLEANAFYDYIRNQMKSKNIPRGALKIEVTETSLMKDIDTCCQNLENLKKLGIRIAIDDFGTGYSSMGYLAKLPLTTLKIDRSFVMQINKEPQSEKIINAILKLASELELDVVAEGIEKVSDAAYLREKSCTYGQGFLYSRPVQLDDFMSLMKSWNANSLDYDQEDSLSVRSAS